MTYDSTHLISLDDLSTVHGGTQSPELPLPFPRPLPGPTFPPNPLPNPQPNPLPNPFPGEPRLDLPALPGKARGW